MRFVASLCARSKLTTGCACAISRRVPSCASETGIPRRASAEVIWRGELRLTCSDLSGQALLVSARAIPQRGPSCDVDGHAGLLQPDDGRDGGELESRDLLESRLHEARTEGHLQWQEDRSISGHVGN